MNEKVDETKVGTEEAMVEKGANEEGERDDGDHLLHTTRKIR